MAEKHSHDPRLIAQIMVSSTFEDLKNHREALIKSIKAHGLTDVAMENDPAKIEDIIESSLQMVRDCSAYVAIIGKRYGQIPKSAQRNPNGYSITELEFEEALRIGRPILLFVMGKDHLVHEDHIEKVARNKKKLDAFIARAKMSSPSSEVERVYAEFDSLEDFKEKIGPAIARLSHQLDVQRHKAPDAVSSADPIAERNVEAVIPNNLPRIIRGLFGREDQLALIRNELDPRNPSWGLAIDGQPGIGKTSLAIRAALDCTPGMFDRIVFVSLKDREGHDSGTPIRSGAIIPVFLELLNETAQELGLEGFSKSPEHQRGRNLLDALRSTSVLLIYDNLESLSLADREKLLHFVEFLPHRC